MSSSVSLPVVGSVKLVHIGLAVAILAAAYWYFVLRNKGAGKEEVPVPPPSAVGAGAAGSSEVILPFKRYKMGFNTQEPFLLFEQSAQAKQLLGSSANVVVKRVALAVVDGNKIQLKGSVALNALKLGGNGRPITEGAAIPAFELGAIQMSSVALNNLMQIQGDAPAPAAGDKAEPVKAASGRRGDLVLYVIAQLS